MTYCNLINKNKVTDPMMFSVFLYNYTTQLYHNDNKYLTTCMNSAHSSYVISYLPMHVIIKPCIHYNVQLVITVLLIQKLLRDALLSGQIIQIYSQQAMHQTVSQLFLYNVANKAICIIAILQLQLARLVMVLYVW